MKSLFFVHIPKTAGTSLRRGACKVWNKRKVMFDYGDTIATSDDITRLLYQNDDIFALKNFLIDRKIRFLSGHRPVKYLYPIFPSNNIFTFARDPVDRVLSHYNFVCQQENYRGGIEQFCTDPENKNTQSRYLRDFPPELMGFIGLSERYSESLTLLNQHYGTRIPELKLNTSQDLKGTGEESRKVLGGKPEEIPGAPRIHQSDNAIKDLILRNNEQDVQLYNIATRLFNERLRCYKEKTDYTYGKVQKLQSSFVEGWATNPGQQNPTRIEISVDGEPIAQLEANQFRPPLKHRNAPRDGYIGFRYKFASPLQAGSVVRCRACHSSQLLIGPSKVSTAVPSQRSDQQDQAA